MDLCAIGMRHILVHCGSVHMTREYLTLYNPDDVACARVRYGHSTQPHFDVKTIRNHLSSYFWIRVFRPKIEFNSAKCSDGPCDSCAVHTAHATWKYLIRIPINIPIVCSFSWIGFHVRRWQSAQNISADISKPLINGMRWDALATNALFIYSPAMQSIPMSQSTPTTG